MVITSKRIALILFVILATYLNSISEEKHFERIDMVSGLSHNSALCLLEDHDGFVWIGTRDGLNRYDGVNFETYKHVFFDSTSLVNNLVNCLYETKDLLSRIEQNVLSHQPDLTVVMVGTNDMLNSKKMISNEEYAHNLSFIVGKLKSTGSQVLLMSSPPVDSAYLFNRHDKNLYSQAPNVIMGSISRIVGRIAHDNHFLFLNLFEKFLALNLPKHNQDLFFRNEKNSGVKDGVHPTALGYHFIASNVFQFLKEQRLIDKNLKIVCFGDSITYGAGSTGGGTIDGKNYPSYLAQMIDDYLKQ